MTRLLRLIVLIVPLAACARQVVNSGSSPNVPKPTIEKAADTKIPDAGPESAAPSAQAP